ncbi:MAG: hypothetical protein ABIL09_29865 [Gemmatimonadota bacterium]
MSRPNHISLPSRLRPAFAWGPGRAWTLLLAVLCGLLGPRPGAAHRLNNSRTAVLVTADSLKLELAIDETDLLAGFALDRNGDGVLWRDEMAAGIPAVSEYVNGRVRLEGDGQPIALERQAAYVDPDPQGNLYLSLRYGARLVRPPAALDIYVDLFDRFSEGHKNLTTVRAYGGEPQPAVFSSQARHRRFVLRKGAAPWGLLGLGAAAAVALVSLGAFLVRRARR